MIAGLKLAIDLSAQQLTIHSDSQLVVSQVNGDYQAREENMQNYLVKVRQLMAALKEVKVEYIPRERNERDDELSKLASMRKIGCHKTIVHETLGQPSITEE